MTDADHPDAGATVLDNMAWHGLHGPQRDLAEFSSNGAAARYRHRISPIFGVGELDQAAWDGMAELCAGGRVASLFRDEVTTSPDGWDDLFISEVVQYTAGDLADPPAGLDLLELGEDDAEEMLALAKLTEPGPFAIETYKLGRYFGIRRDGALIAMAGERMRTPGWGEVSGVCVHPDAVREGLGAAMTLAAAKAIEERGDRAMLHVASANDPAHALYLKLGFTVRRRVQVGVYRALS